MSTLPTGEADASQFLLGSLYAGRTMADSFETAGNDDVETEIGIFAYNDSDCDTAISMLRTLAGADGSEAPVVTGRSFIHKFTIAS